jgi:hypothetical protein
MEQSVEKILRWFKEAIEAKKPIAPTQFIEASEYLNILIGNENDKLAELEQKVAQEKLSLMEKSESVAEAKMKIEATDIYKEAKQQRSRIAQIIEFIRLGKIHARIYSDELRG